jgi:hypothetical protein
MATKANFTALGFGGLQVTDAEKASIEEVVQALGPH